MRIDAKLEKEIADLGGLPREELAVRWDKQHGCPPPLGVRRELLIRSAAWHLQAKWLGGLSADTRRRLKDAVRRADGRMTQQQSQLAKATQPPATSSGNMYRASGDVACLDGVDPLGSPQSTDGSAADLTLHRSSLPSPPPPRRSPAAGARLLRDWNGRTHVVDVTKEGFVYEGRHHRSLSSIAREITGAHWSGPRFFGL